MPFWNSPQRSSVLSKALALDQMNGIDHCNHRQGHRERLDIGGVNQRVLAQVSETLCGFDLGAAENLMHFIQATSEVDPKAGEAVAQVMGTDIGPRPTSGCLRT